LNFQANTEVLRFAQNDSAYKFFRSLFGTRACEQYPNRPCGFNCLLLHPSSGPPEPSHRRLPRREPSDPALPVSSTGPGRPRATVDLSRPRIQRLSPSFSSTSWKENYNSFYFNNILESPQTDIFSPFVLNNIVELTFILGPPFFRHPGHPRID